ncbi:MAG: class I SAM-dependent methyltransferase [Rhodospirillales bacterium]|nr:class I SAM-dependent methyltransferase [Rhodospirillales bacterium]
MANPLYQRIIDEFFGASPYDGLETTAVNEPAQGWASDSPVFETLIDEYLPTTIIEVGTWKGASAIHMARLATRHNPNSLVICIDTWLGSAAHWTDPTERVQLGLKQGYPTLYYRFLDNVVAAGLTEHILPIPLPAASALAVLSQVEAVGDLIYIDADHDAMNVYSDVSGYWPLVRGGGAMFGDDYLANWPGVVKSVNLFAEKNGITLGTYQEKWLLRK